MGVQVEYHWRFFDKSGNVVAEGMSPRESDDGDFYLNDDGHFENKKSGELRNGDIQRVDKNGNPVDGSYEPDSTGKTDGSIRLVNNGGSSDKPRAFGEIRVSGGSGVSPAFEQANHNDKPKVENPENPQPDTPTPPPNNGGSGGSLIGEIAKQNDILNRLVSKIGQTTGLNKISRGLGSLERAFKGSIENLSKEVAKGANTVALNSSGNKVSAALKGVNENLAKIAEIKGDVAKISENGKGLLDIEKDRHAYEKTPQTIKDLDGETVANLSPRDAQTVKNITQAKTATDTNNFELDGNDILDLFDGLPDPSGLFDFPMPYEIDKDFAGGK
nr:hypothetical protein [uncultured Campylobacter sp.]